MIQSGRSARVQTMAMLVVALLCLGVAAGCAAPKAAGGSSDKYLVGSWTYKQSVLTADSSTDGELVMRDDHTGLISFGDGGSGATEVEFTWVVGSDANQAKLTATGIWSVQNGVRDATTDGMAPSEVARLYMRNDRIWTRATYDSATDAVSLQGPSGSKRVTNATFTRKK